MGVTILTTVFYAVAMMGLVASFITDRERTGFGLKKAWMAFGGILPEFVVVIVVAGLILAHPNQATGSKNLGRHSGWEGVAGAALVGSVTLVPGFVAVPFAALLLEQGAGLVQIAAVQTIGTSLRGMLLVIQSVFLVP